MYRLILFLIPFILISCDKDNNQVDDQFSYLNTPLTHFELGFELDEPDVILNDIATGELDVLINSILVSNNGNTERKLEFEHIDNTNKISKMSFFLPHYQNCEKNIYQFYYNSQNLIDTIVSTRKNFCNEFEVLKTYTFNYNFNGLLKSIFMYNDYFLEENYFGYYPNGKIKEIYNDHHGRGVESSFGLQKFYYDDTFSNVIRLETFTNASPSYTYKYFYDDNKNPFKNTFVAVSVYMPFFGPAYLSKNNVIKIIKKNENNIHGNEFTDEYIFNFSSPNVLDTYYELGNGFVYFVNQ
ncbi:MAG: hypothetical protein QNK89_02395 [Lacinutrix sp.]|uniref:hypothetical protein n=1 Tax=Lacinutrix sp. TaxID=1937692 RepID=UPI003099C4F5